MKMNFRGQFFDALKYVDSNKRYVYFSVFIFLFSVFFGFYNYLSLGFLDQIIEKLMSEAKDMNACELIFFILQNNFQASLFAMVFGIFAGIFSLTSIISNGVVVGYVMAKVSTVAGFWEFWRLLPHGVFELPAIFISVGLGMKLGISVFFKGFKKAVKYDLYGCLNVFFFVVIPLLVVAAVIEGILIAFI